MTLLRWLNRPTPVPRWLYWGLLISCFLNGFATLLDWLG